MVSRMLRYPATVFGDLVALVDIHRSAIVSNVMLDFAGPVHVPVTWSLTCLFSHQERGAVAGVQSRDDPVSEARVTGDPPATPASSWCGLDGGLRLRSPGRLRRPRPVTGQATGPQRSG